ncbi:MAG TPA: hypothetical protein VF595_17390 [Tepidisphaeraceae bacterium]|jgi:hypothetical protein
MSEPYIAPTPPPLAYAMPADRTVNTDIEHLRLLSIFHFIVGGIQLLIGCFPIIYLVLGILIVIGQLDGSASNGDPTGVGWVLIAIGLFVTTIAWTIGALTIYSGFQMKRRRWRTFSIVVAAVNCIHFPFGTTLGVFTLIVLLRRSVEELYRSTART